MNESTHPRERLITTASNLVHRQGWTITGINQILTDAGIPKGSFYYYFRSKEALGVALLDRYHGNLKSLLDSTLGREDLAAEAALAAFVARVSQGPLADEYRFGCLAGNLAAEIATQCPALLDKACETLKLYGSSFEGLIARATAAGHVVSHADPKALAASASLLLQGSLIAVKCQANFAPLYQAHAALECLLFGTPLVASTSPRSSTQVMAS